MRHLANSCRPYRRPGIRWYLDREGRLHVRGQVMKYKSVAEGKPKPLTRVWVMTDTGRETTGYVKSDGEWHINCERIRATGAKVLRWKEG